VVSWKNVFLRRSDVALFQDGNWLNDECITFFFEHLASKHCAAAARVLFLGAETAFWLLLEEDEEDLADAANGLEIREKDLILCPINDNTDRTRAGAGTHWSLLVARAVAPRTDHAAGSKGAPLVPSMGWEYYDSMPGGSNFGIAQRLARKLVAMRGPCGGAASSAGQAIVTDVAAARQTNSCDCGVYVLLFAEAVLEAFLRGGGEAPAVASISPADATSKRLEALAIIKAAATSKG